MQTLTALFVVRCFMIMPMLQSVENMKNNRAMQAGIALSTAGNYSTWRNDMDNGFKG